MTALGAAGEARDAAEALRQFFAYAGELPLVAHNGATFDGPLIEATCRRLGVGLFDAFRCDERAGLAEKGNRRRVV